jgi:molecular chaperone IbpA
MRTTLTLDNYLSDMLKDLNRFAVGYEPTLRTLDSVRQTSSQGFPPYDLIKISDSEYQLSLAVAGYSANDLEITEHEGVLSIAGKVANNSNTVFLHKGIAGRSFKRSFYLDQYVYVKNSSLENGILTINFVKEVPESLKPRRIEINSVPAIEG